jgi:hypothetical protein
VRLRFATGQACPGCREELFCCKALFASSSAELFCCKGDPCEGCRGPHEGCRDPHEGSRGSGKGSPACQQRLLRCRTEVLAPRPRVTSSSQIGEKAPLFAQAEIGIRKKTRASWLAAWTS